MTEEHKASRTIVKSPPELWAECSDAQSLARHLGEFGEIKITRLEPETTVAWEGEHASGTVRLEPSGWGTHVTLTATSVVIPEPVHEVVEPEVVEPEEPEGHEEVEEVAPPEPEVEDGRGRRGGRGQRRGNRRTPSRMAGGSFESASRASRSSVEPEEAEGEDAEADRDARGSGRARVRGGRCEEPTVVAAAPEPVADEVPEAVADEPPAAEEPTIDAEALLVAALDSLGQAHHRPFSRG